MNILGQKPQRQKWFLLSFFDGIGCARCALEPLIQHWNLEIRFLAWEVDEVCCRITTAHYPDMIHRGNIFTDNMDDISKYIHDADPAAEWGVLICAGPPCPDFSRIKGDSGAGREGPEGRKFADWLDTMSELQPKLLPRLILRLVENVIPHRKQDIKFFENKMDAKAVQMDSNMFGLISRPRLWWSDIKWDTNATEIMEAPTTWSWQYDTPKLHLHIPKDSQEFGPPDWQPPTTWTKLGKTLPTLTTPAETAEGRPAPRSAKGRMDSGTYQR